MNPKVGSPAIVTQAADHMSQRENALARCTLSAERALTAASVTAHLSRLSLTGSCRL